MKSLRAMARGRRKKAKKSKAPARRNADQPTPSHSQPPARSTEAGPKQRRLQQTTIEHISQEWQGPIPPPGILMQFDQVVDGGAERLFKSFEQQSKHRRRMESWNAFSEGFQRMAGSVFGFVTVMATLWYGYQLIQDGKDLSGITAMLGGLATVASVFVGGGLIQRRRSKQEKKESQLSLDLFRR